jgi:hypothetical protein
MDLLWWKSSPLQIITAGIIIPYRGTEYSDQKGGIKYAIFFDIFADYPFIILLLSILIQLLA